MDKIDNVNGTVNEGAARLDSVENRLDIHVAKSNTSDRSDQPSAQLGPHLAVVVVDISLCKIKI